MKKTIKFFIAAMLAAMTALSLKGAEDPILIPVIRLPETPGQDLDRGPAQQLFLAEYNDLLNDVILMCTEDCGEVSVTLCSSAGDWFQTVFDTEDGTLIIPVSGDEGHYVLSITTPDGTYYIGEFTI